MSVPTFFKNRSPESQTAKPAPTPQELFDKAVADTDYSNEACRRSCAPRTIILTGVEEGEEKTWVPGKARKGGRRTKQIFSGKSASGGDKDDQSQGVYRDREGGTPAFATIGVTWAEPGRYKGRNAYFLRLHVQHHGGTGRLSEQIELVIRLWNAGDAIRSMTALATESLSAIETPAALDLAAVAPEIALFGPRAAVGRPVGTPVERFDKHLQPGDRWCFFAEACPPHFLAHVRPKDEDVSSVLRIVSCGDYNLKEPAPNFEIGLVVLADRPFDLTAFSTITLQHGGDRVKRHLVSPYNPIKISGKLCFIPKGQKRIGEVDFGSDRMVAKWEKIVNWTKPFDTIWFGNGYGCVDGGSSPARCCNSRRCRYCRPSRGASTYKVIHPTGEPTPLP